MNKESTLGNLYDREKVTLACIFCGAIKNLGLVSHRDKWDRIVGFVFVCGSCEHAGKLNNKQIIVDLIKKD